MAAGVCGAQTAAPPLKASPAALTFQYTEGDAKLPVAQTLSVSGGNSAAPLQYSVAITGAPWLAATPATGTAPAAVKVSANPTSLSVGTYTAALTVSSVGGPRRKRPPWP